MANPFDQFDDKGGKRNPFDQFDPKTADGGITEAAYQLVGPGFNKGLNSVLSVPGDVAAWSAKKVGVDPETADKIKFENTTASKFLTSGLQPTTTLGRYGESAGKFVGSSVVPGGMVMKAAPIAVAAAPAVTTIGKALQHTGQQIAANPGNAALWDVAGNVAGGLAHQGAVEAGAPPVVQNVAGMVGGMAPVAVAAGTSAARNTIGRAFANQGEAGAYGSMIDDLGGDVNRFANQVAVGPSRTNTTGMGNNRRALDILGEEMVNHGSDANLARQAAIDRIATELNVTPATAQRHLRNLTQVHEENPLMMGEYPTVAASDAEQRLRAPGNIDLDALGRRVESPLNQTMDYLANNGNAQSATNVRNAVHARQEDLAPQFRQMLAESGPGIPTGPNSSRPATIGDVEALVENARQTGSAAYRAAYNGPINQQLADVIMPRLVGYERHRALQRAGDPRTAIERALSQLERPDANGQPVVMTSLQQLQDARAAIRGHLDSYRATPGQAGLANAVQPIYDRLTRVMENMSPLWATANRQWADMNFNRMGTELGDAFTTKASPQFRQQLREFQQMAPEAQNIVRVHFLQKLDDKFENLGDAHSISKMFSNDQSRNMIRQILGDEAAVTFSRAVRDNAVAEATGNMMKNSATHRRGVTQKQKDAETGIVGAVKNANTQGLKHWLAERAMQLLTERKNRPLAEIMTTPMSDTARVAEHIYRMQQQAARLAQYERPAFTMNPVTTPVGTITTDDRDQARKQVVGLPAYRH